MIKVENLFLTYTKAYNTLNDINFVVEKGETLIILGQKESGKDSLIRILASLEKPTSGKVLINDLPLDKLNLEKDIHLGYLSDFGAFLNNKTVRQNLEYVLKIRKYSKEDIVQRVNAALLLNAMGNIAEEKVKNLTYFEKLKVAAVRLTLRNIDVLIIDDIFANLSDNEREEMVRIINKIMSSNENITSIVAISDLSLAEKFGGNIIKLKFGSIVE